MGRQAVDVLEQEVKRIVGDAFVLTDPSARHFHSLDLSVEPAETAKLVILPGSVEELAQVVRAVAGAGHALGVRGGGTSYTPCFAPRTNTTVLLDMKRMNRIVEINPSDRYVVVESGCTWQALGDALRKAGLRTPHVGPVSGRWSTIGGTVAQNGISLGAGREGTIAESVLGVEVVLADGRILRTGSWARREGRPYNRYVGPDLTGLFIGDSGAFGIKARIALRLVDVPETVLCLSAGFNDMAGMVSAQTEIARQGLAADSYGFDPARNAAMETYAIDPAEGLATLARVALHQGVRGAFALIRGGRSFLRGVAYSLHMSFEGRQADAARKRALAICRRHGGVRIPEVVPAALRADTFGGLEQVLFGPDGEIWVAVHCCVPLSEAAAMLGRVEDYFREQKSRLARHGISASFFTSHARGVFFIEPVFWWKDRIDPLRRHLAGERAAERWRGREENPAARREVRAMCAALRDLFSSSGADYIQPGVFYPYAEDLSGTAAGEVVSGLKEMLDPQRLISPGALGLGGASLRSLRENGRDRD